MRTVAFYATETPRPEFRYAGLPTSGGTVYIRALDVTNYGDPLVAASKRELAGETLLNTLEIGGR